MPRALVPAPFAGDGAAKPRSPGGRRRPQTSLGQWLRQSAWCESGGGRRHHCAMPKMPPSCSPSPVTWRAASRRPQQALKICCAASVVSSHSIAPASPAWAGVVCATKDFYAWGWVLGCRPLCELWVLWSPRRTMRSPAHSCRRRPSQLPGARSLGSTDLRSRMAELPEPGKRGTKKEGPTFFVPRFARPGTWLGALLAPEFRFRGAPSKKSWHPHLYFHAPGSH